MFGVIISAVCWRVCVITRCWQVGCCGPSTVCCLSAWVWSGCTSSLPGTSTKVCHSWRYRVLWFAGLICEFLIVLLRKAWQLFERWLHVDFQPDKEIIFTKTIALCGPGQPSLPPYPFTSPSFPLSCTFHFFSFFLTLSSFLIVHPFPFYQNRPTPFPGQKS